MSRTCYPRIRFASRKIWQRCLEASGGMSSDEPCLFYGDKRKMYRWALSTVPNSIGLEGEKIHARKREKKLLTDHSGCFGQRNLRCDQLFRYSLYNTVIVCLLIYDVSGLFDTRIRGLREVTDRFLFLPIFRIGLQPPLKVYGVGSFTYDSYLIFRYLHINTGCISLECHRGFSQLWSRQEHQDY
jgi:hypothetical protein